MRVEKKDMVPPDDIGFVFGAGDYLAVGEKVFRIFKERCGLKPDGRVLDVGCGAGRLAIPLTDYLAAPGGYHGFDTFPLGIEWCQKHIAPHFPNFTFELADIYNSTYNPFSPVKASEFVFPHDDATFDLVVLKSVFTHMFPDEILNYTAQIARVLKPGGSALITFFLQNAEAAEFQKKTGKGPGFHKFGLFYSEDLENPLDCVGYDESFVRSMFARNSLHIEEIIPGNWCGRDGKNFQDYIILRKE